MLYQSFSFLNHHIGDLNVAGGRLIKGRGDNFSAASAHRALHFGHFFRALVDEENNDVALWIVADNCLSDALHHDRFTRLGWCNQQAALSFSDWRAQIDNSAC